MRRLRRLAFAGLCTFAFLSGSACTSAAENQTGCWSLEELAGRPEEKEIRHVPYDPSIEPKGEAVILPSLPESMRGSIRGVKLPQGEKLVALTFDLCENPDEISGYDAEIVDALRRANVKATFFPSGKWLLDHRERAEQLLADPLFQVGAHSWTHRNFRLLQEDDVKADLALDLKADDSTRQSVRAKECYKPVSSDMRRLRAPHLVPLSVRDMQRRKPESCQRRWPARHSMGCAFRRSCTRPERGSDSQGRRRERQARLDHRHARQRPGLAHGRSLASPDRRSPQTRLRVRNRRRDACQRANPSSSTAATS